MKNHLLTGHFRALTDDGAAALHYLVRHSFPDIDAARRVRRAHSPARLLNAKQVIRTMVERGLDPNVPNRQGESPLHQAARRGREPNMVVLLSLKANPNCFTKSACRACLVLTCATGKARPHCIMRYELDRLEPLECCFRTVRTSTFACLVDSLLWPLLNNAYQSSPQN
jgi:ankyrin repeat protein